MGRKAVQMMTCFAVLLVMLFSGSYGPVMAQEPQVTVVPAVSYLAVGQQVYVDVVVENVDDLFGAEFHLSYDPALIEVVDMDASIEGIQVGIGSVLAADFVPQNRADNGTGTIDFGISQMSPNTAVSGSGTLATIAVRGKANGTASLAFTAVLLADSGGGQISATWQNGSITIGEANGATPTPVATVIPVTATPEPVQSVCAFQGYHTVKVGETLYSIGRAYATVPNTIAVCNGLVNPSSLMAGTKLGIPVDPWVSMPAGPIAVAQFTATGETVVPSPTATPVSGSEAPSSSCSSYHTVLRGQTLTSIAATYNSTVWGIIRANAISNPNLIYRGQVLCIP